MIVITFWINKNKSNDAKFNPYLLAFDVDVAVDDVDDDDEFELDDIRFKQNVLVPTSNLWL